MVAAVESMLIECDPSIKAIIFKLDAEHNNSIIVQDLDDTTLIVKRTMLGTLKTLLEQVLAETQQPADDSGSE